MPSVSLLCRAGTSPFFSPFRPDRRLLGSGEGTRGVLSFQTGRDLYNQSRV